MPAVKAPERIFKEETKWMWVDEDGVQCSPLHDTLGTAIRHKGSWKPFNSRDQYKYRKNYGSTKPPTELRKIEVIYRFVDDAEVKIISDAFVKSDAAEAGQTETEPKDDE